MSLRSCSGPDGATSADQGRELLLCPGQVGDVGRGPWEKGLRGCECTLPCEAERAGDAGVDWPGGSVLLK